MRFPGLKSSFPRLTAGRTPNVLNRFWSLFVVFAALSSALCWAEAKSILAQQEVIEGQIPVTSVLSAPFFFPAVLFLLGVALVMLTWARRQKKREAVAWELLSAKSSELALAQNEAASQKRILQFVLDHVGDSVVVFDASGALILQNGAAKSLFQNIELATDLETWERAVVLHDTESNEVLAPDEMPVRVALKGGIFVSRLLEIQNPTQSEPRFVLAEGYPLLDRMGLVEAAIGCFRDVTENLQREMELRKAKIVAEDASKSKTEFLANMSHEIRTPMTTILGYADILLRPSLTPQELRQNVETIRRNGQVLMTLIDDILDVSRIESGRLRIDKTAVLLGEVLSELHSLLASRAEEKKIGFSIAIEGKVPKQIYTAPVRLRQILINLAGNAIKFTEKGGVKIAVRCERPSPDKKPLLVFDVSDTGCGIASHVIESLFSPFVQVDTKANRLYGGSGLGLSLSRRLAKALGGDVRLVSTAVGVGSHFVIEMDPGEVDMSDWIDLVPLKTVPLSALPTQILESSILRGVEVLLVDDSPENLALFAYFLRSAGAIVTKANDGQSALNCAKEREFDLILLDIQMPRMDGYETRAKLRALNYRGPIVALTAHAMLAEANACKTAGFDGFLNKPIGFDTLVESVRAAVDKSIGKSSAEPAPPTPLFSSRVLNSSEKVRNIISIFVKNIPTEVNTIKTACEGRDWDEVVKNTHRFKGTAGSCGFMSLMEEISKLEDAVLSGDTEKVAIAQRIDRLEAMGASSARDFRANKTVGI